MKVFQIVKQVLDQEYKYLEGEGSKKDKSIKDALGDLGSIYKKVINAGGPNLESATIRFAYIYRYTTAHADMVYGFINRYPTLSELFDRELLTISCIGGGPGSDLLGVFKYVLNEEKNLDLFFYLLDKEGAWGESWADVDQISRSVLSSSTNFRTLDVCDKKSWQGQRKFLQADLFTFIYFFSEIYTQKAKANPFFDYMFAGAAKGARFLYIDFRDSRLSDWFDELCKKHEISVVSSGDESFQINYDEQKTDLADYFGKFDNPKITARISFRVCKK